MRKWSSGCHSGHICLTPALHVISLYAAAKKACQGNCKCAGAGLRCKSLCKCDGGCINNDSEWWTTICHGVPYVMYTCYKSFQCWSSIAYQFDWDMIMMWWLHPGISNHNIRALHHKPRLTNIDIEQLLITTSWYWWKVHLHILLSGWRYLINLEMKLCCYALSTLLSEQ